MPDIMTVKNPTRDRVSSEFADYLNDMAEDFDIRYCAIVLTQEVRSYLYDITQGNNEADAKVALLLLKSGGLDQGIEIMIG